MAEFLGILSCLCHLAVIIVVDGNYWQLQRDDLSTYHLDKSSTNVKSDIECTTLAQLQHQAVGFSQADGTCRMYSCKFGQSGCRKCRHANNRSLPVLLVRWLDQLGHTCWRTFQHRVDASFDFYRNWTEYLTSFGQGEDLNYWLGLQAIHQLTQAGDRRVRWEMSTWNDSWWWWENQLFVVQGSDQGFRVTVGDLDVSVSNVMPSSYLSYTMNNQQFSTLDKDQDASSVRSCAERFHSAWWHRDCQVFNPNGRYFTPPTALNLTGNDWAAGITFCSEDRVYPFNYSYSMQTFECMVTDFAPGV